MKREVMTASQFEELYRRTAPDLDAYLRRRIGPAAPDLLSEVYVTAWRRRKDLPEQELLRAWLFGVARRVILTYLRERSRALDVEHASTSVRSDVQTADPDTRTSAVQEALQSLAEIDRELIQLTAWEGLRVSEAALSLGMKPGAARVRLHRARRRLAADSRLQSVMERN